MPLSTLSKGYKKPSNPTSGDLFFPAMEDNIQLMNDHVHNGVTGAITPSATGTALSTDWGSDLGGGSYRQVITMPTGFSFDTTNIQVRRSTGEMVYPTIEKISSTTFYLYTNNNGIAYNILYG